MRHQLISLPDVERFSAPEHPGGDNRGERDFYRRIVAEAIRSQLTQKQREAMELHYLKGQSVTEIAQALSLQPSSVSRRLSGAKMRIGRFARACVACAPRYYEA